MSGTHDTLAARDRYVSLCRPGRGVNSDGFLGNVLAFHLKRHNQAKNHPQANILLTLLDMSIICEHVHRLEMWRSFIFWAAVAT